VITFEFRNKEFVHALADVMNENAERLVEAWEKGAGKATQESEPSL
jgi:ribosome-associated toxin RatA of RatAB toxin-antitoxin module